MGKLEKGTALAVGAAAAAVGGQASAATITVNSLLDTVAVDGQCTLREALDNANNNAATNADCAAGSGVDIVDLSGLTGTIVLGGTQLTISDSVTLQGPAAGTLTVDGNLASRLFYISNGGAALDVTISRLTLTRGTAAAGLGSAILNRGETVTLSNVTVTANTSARGAVAIPPGVGGTLNIQDSVISGNSGPTNGGGVYANGFTALTINNSTLTGNSVPGKGGALFAFNSAGTLTIANSSITTNNANSRGGGIALYRLSGPVTISGGTISGNTTGGRGGGLFLYQTLSPATVSISNSVVSGNTAGTRGGGMALYKVNVPVTIQRHGHLGQYRRWRHRTWRGDVPLQRNDRRPGHDPALDHQWQHGGRWRRWRRRTFLLQDRLGDHARRHHGVGQHHRQSRRRRLPARTAR